MGQLNIKDAALIAEAKELAALLGTSTTGALREAVRERLARERAGRQGRAERLMAIAAEAAPLFPAGTGSDHGEFYDEQGLPR